MGIKTPHPIKVKVIKGWIQGISHDKIALDNNIVAGTVTSFIQQVKSSFPDMVLMRELALKIKQDFASSVRLKYWIDWT